MNSFWQSVLISTRLYSATGFAILFAFWFGSSDLAGQNLLQNGDFEQGGRGSAAAWMTIYPPSIQKPAPVFELAQDDVHGGVACGLLETSQPGGYSSYTQKIRGDRKATLARFSAWLRVDELGQNSSASIMLLFVDEAGAMLGLHRSRPLQEVGGWTQLQVEVPVPDGATQWMVRCGILGQGRVAFDDAELIGEKLKGEHVAVELAVHHGDYVVRTSSAKKAPWVGLSIPFPFASQTPLAVRVTSEPEDMVARLEIYAEHENRPLRVILKPTKRGAEVKLRIETLTMVSDRELSDGVQVQIAKRSKVPKDVRQHLKAAPGVDVSSKSVREAAKGFDKTDLHSLMADVSAYLKQNLKYDGGRSQGAEECLDEGSAVCTGFANVAASLLIASDVPTRILACTQLSGRLQEHYIVEAWTPQLGWSRIESTMAKFPWKDSNNLVIRVIYPDSKRSQVDVPIFVETGGGAKGGFNMGSDTCWQGADPLQGALLAKKGYQSIEKFARKSFQRLLKKPASTAAVRFTPDAKQAKKLKLDPRGLRLLETVDNWLEQG